MPLAPAKFKPGDTVILGRHDYVAGVGDSWNPDMNPFIGRVATIQEAYLPYSKGVAEKQGSHLWIVDIDGGQFYWREINMVSATDIKPSQSSPGDLLPAVNDFICPSCGNDRCSSTERTCWKCGNRLHS